MKKKKLFNYKKALTVPFMIQKLWRGFTLENPLELTKVVVFGGTLIALFTVLRPLMLLLGVLKGLDIAAYILLPVGMVMLWDKLEPDGLKIPQYVIDFLFYLITYKIGRKVINQNQTFTDLKEKELIVFEKISG